MQLLDRTGFIADDWLRSGEGGIPEGEVPRDARVIVPLARIEEALALDVAALGVEIPTATPFPAIERHLGHVSLVSIAVGGFADGRGFSLAYRIRRSGFAGRIRLTGPLIPDQFAYALACGVDQIALPRESAARQPVEQWMAAISDMRATYQRGYARGQNILHQRRAARKAAQNG